MGDSNSTLHVMMMGGRRCGKTTILSSIFSEMKNSKTREVFTVSDRTELKTKDGEKQESLTRMQLELENFISLRPKTTFLVDKNPTRTFWDYTLQFNIPGKKESMNITFTDAPGETCDKENPLYDKFLETANDCDVFIVVIDTPYLMSDKPAEAHLANLINSIHDFLTGIDKEKAKQVIFVPIKCEKWVKSNKIDEVINKFEDYYGPTIHDLCASEKIEISIIPVESVGDIEFSDLREPSVLKEKSSGNVKDKCSVVDDSLGLVILSDGTSYMVTEDEFVDEPDDKLFDIGGEPTNITRRTEWFTILKEDPHYKPYNCEQIPLHIIRFMFKKKKSETPKRWFDFLRDFFGGSITNKDMCNALDKLKESGAIKDDEEGIRVLKSF